jgi:hypothetical protein
LITLGVAGARQPRTVEELGLIRVFSVLFFLK